MIACTKHVSRITKRTVQIIKKPCTAHHLGRYLSNNDTFVRDGAVKDIEQIWAEFFAVRPVANFMKLLSVKMDEEFDNVIWIQC